MNSLRDAQRRLNALEREARRGEEFVIRNTADDLERTAIRFSGGPLRPKDLARMDHPYATRHGSPLLNPGIINKKSGAFAGAWRLRVRRKGSGWLGEVFNVDPKAAFLEEGTLHMFARPVAQQVMADVKPRLEARWRFLLHRLRSL